MIANLLSVYPGNTILNETRFVQTSMNLLLLVLQYQADTLHTIVDWLESV